MPKFARDTQGRRTRPRAIPQSIARTALDDKVAILTDNAGEDARFAGQSIVMQQMRSAICVPADGQRGAGARRAVRRHRSTATHRFSEDDLDFCIAFAGIAAVAIENGEFVAAHSARGASRATTSSASSRRRSAQRIADSSETIRLGGDKRPVAVLFSDIRGFTALAESMRPEDTASLLTEYFTEMVDCVFRHDGTLDKFMGDALMAQWGAPIGGDR